MGDWPHVKNRAQGRQRMREHKAARLVPEHRRRIRQMPARSSPVDESDGSAAQPINAFPDVNDRHHQHQNFNLTHAGNARLLPPAPPFP